MSSKLYSGPIHYEWIQCEYEKSSKTVYLKGRLGEISMSLGQYYKDHGPNWIEVNNLPNYLKTRLKQMDQGLTIGYTRELFLTGVFHKVQQEGKKLTFHLGYSHPIYYELPDHVEFRTRKKGSERSFMLLSIDNELVSQVAAQIYHLKKPEPYKGTGFRYKHQILSKKIGKKK